MNFSLTKILPVTFVTLLALSICSNCTKEDEKNQLTQQEKEIDLFISRDTANAINLNKDTMIVVTNKKETNRVVWNPCLGDTLAPGDTAAFAFIGYIFRSGKGQAFVADYEKNVVGAGYFISGLDAGLVGMRAGEYAYIIFTSKYGYGNKELSAIPKMSPLMFEVEIDYIVKKR